MFAVAVNLCREGGRPEWRGPLQERPLATGPVSQWDAATGSGGVPKAAFDPGSAAVLEGSATDQGGL